MAHLETAIYQAILADESQEGLRTKTVHSEILYNLNPTHNVRLSSLLLQYPSYS